MINKLELEASLGRLFLEKERIQAYLNNLVVNINANVKRLEELAQEEAKQAAIEQQKLEEMKKKSLEEISQPKTETEKQITTEEIHPYDEQQKQTAEDKPLAS